jgi:tRNA_anti-like
MSRKRIIWTIVLIVAVAGGYYGYKQYTRTNKMPRNTKAKYMLSADTLISQFETQDSVYYKKYDDQIIEVTGVLKNSSLGDFTIMLGNPGDLSSVKCELDTTLRNTTVFPAIGSEVKVRGHFVGFQKEEMMEGVSLGLDVSLNRCIILNNDKK